jgi:hypothetical protein
MPQRTVEPKSFTFANKASQATTIATLRTNIQAGKKIVRADLNAIVGMMNDMLGHYHTYEDRIQNREIFGEFGQAPAARDGTVYTVDKISVSFGQNYYHLEGYKRPLLRHEILKVS